MTKEDYDKKADKVLSIYEGMWTWIRDNIEELREKYYLRDAKAEYLRNTDKNIYLVFGYCALCEAYTLCSQCYLKGCRSELSTYGTLHKYFNKSSKKSRFILYKPVKTKDAVKCCDRILKAHSELRQNLTQVFLDKLDMLEDV